jgi:hypothetical protein
MIIYFKKNKNLPTKKRPSKTDLLLNSSIPFKEELTLMLLKVLKKYKGKKYYQTHFTKPVLP